MLLKHQSKVNNPDKIKRSTIMKTRFKRAVRKLKLPKLPNLRFLFGKKQLIIASLTVVLGAAVVVNYLLFTQGQSDDLIAGGNYGDTMMVSDTTDASPTIDSKDSDSYFAQARIDKQAARDEAKEFLSAMYNGGDASNEDLAVIANDAQTLGGYIESESKIETLLRAQGFSDALVYLSDKGANIIVKTDGAALTPEGAAKIKSTLLSEVTVAAENITIVEIE
jgi:stage III sporulation protein AH